MLIIVTFLLNTALNFALALAVAAVLGPAAYGRFSVAFTAALVAAMLCFDWLRLATTRYYSEDARVVKPEIRASLNLGYMAGSALLIAVGAVMLALGFDAGMSHGLILGAVLFAIATGLFEFFAALLRARFFNGAYNALVIIKNVLAFGGMLAVGALTRQPEPVLLAAAAAVTGSALLLWPKVADVGALARLARADRLSGYLRYGLPIVAANVLYQALILVNRSLAAGAIDFAAAGKLSLATDVSFRLLVSAGAALDILLFQVAVRRQAQEGAEAAREQVARNILVIAAAMTLLCVGYMADMPAFAALLAPERFREDYASLSMIIAPGAALFCLGQFALNPIAQLEHATAPVLIVAVAVVAIDAALVFLAPHAPELWVYAAIHSFSLALGLALMIGLTWRWRAYFPRARDMAAIAVAGLAAAAAMWPLRDLQPRLLALLAVAAAGGVVYGAALYALDPGGLIRPACRKILDRLRRAPKSSPKLCEGQPT